MREEGGKSSHVIFGNYRVKSRIYQLAGHYPNYAIRVDGLRGPVFRRSKDAYFKFTIQGYMRKILESGNQ